ncbi:MAG: N-6 DNA methylase [Solirubrobacterales bacterium]
MEKRKPFQLALPVSEEARTLTHVEASLAPHLPDRQKELGAFYTPPAIAAILADWAIRTPSDRVLDPSFGGLAFLSAASDRLSVLGRRKGEIRQQLFGVDLDPAALEAARTDDRLDLGKDSLILSDFFAVDSAQLPTVEALIGNPPYIRYQGFNGSADRARELAASAGVRLTRLASSWAPFVVYGATFIAPGGRMAQVLPAEILHAQYAQEVVEFLQRSFGHVAMVVFDERVFPGALEEVVLLLADDFGREGTANVQLVSCENVAGLDLGSIGPDKANSTASRTGRDKLLGQLLPASAQELLSALAQRPEVSPLIAVASVDIGVVTGANDFFVLSREAAHGIAPGLLKSGVSKAADVAGARLTTEDHKALLDAGRPVLMFVASDAAGERELGTAMRHIRSGEKRGFHRRYKCRIRDPWWALPIPKQGAPDLLLTYCSNDYPRLALNDARVLQTNTIHGVNVESGVEAAALAAGFYNSLTLLSAELVGRSYGGGVLKLEPTEAEALLLPPMPPCLAELLPGVDQAVRARDIEGALDLVDPIVLGALGLSDADIGELRAGRERLRGRRKRRGRPAR